MAKVQHSSQNGSVNVLHNYEKDGLKKAKKGSLFVSQNGSVLDTLAQPVENGLKPSFLGGSSDALKYAKRARAKYQTLTYLYKLISLDSELLKRYWSTYHCGSYMELQSDGFTSKLVSRFCNQRWCIACNRIRTAKLINGYSEPLLSLRNPQFVTLTNKNCGGCELRERINMMGRIDNLSRQSIRYHLRKRGDVMGGIRKLECTYNPFTNTYNPHYHFIIEGEDNARTMVSNWVKRNKKLGIECKFKGQDIRSCDSNSAMELFKYFTKFVSSKGGDKSYTTVEALDTIFQSILNKRIYQPIGGLTKLNISEDVDKLDAQELSQSLGDLDRWMWSGQDWFSLKTGENFCGYNPSKYDIDFGSKINSKKK